ncbi:MAG: CPBP family intramembrane metalloprotease [Phycisphaerales bacterium]|nr:CPBP family intramembrane metalloprotease [Phycisphaerales bacterium]MCB9857406.1 CPBP family intramembrane metalloprotease [Phycisphaerales bacterium]
MSDQFGESDWDPPATMPSAPPGYVALPIAQPAIAPPKGPGIIDLLIGVGIVWGIELTSGAVVATITIMKSAQDGSSPDDMMAQIGSMAWFLLPLTLLTNLLAVVVCWYMMCRRHSRTLVVGLSLGRPAMRFVVMAIALAVMGNLMAISVLTDDVHAEDVPIYQLMNGGGLGLFAFFAIVIAPMEEIYYRGFLYPLLRKYVGAVGAVLIVSIWFASIHAIQLQGAFIALVPIFVMGFLWTSLRELSGSLWPSIICHVMYNSGLIIIQALSDASQ